MSTHQWTKEQLRRQVKNAIYRVFDAAKNRDFGVLAEMHYEDETLFSKFDDSSPYKRQSIKEALAHEDLTYSNITDFDYKIDELKIDLLSDTVALATFHLETTGLFVNDYRFEGSPAKSKLRVTMVFLWKEEPKEDNENEFEALQKADILPPHWVIVHEHFSRFPEEHPQPERKKRTVAQANQ
jgi:ketosteroid isomerase-like protein